MATLTDLSGIVRFEGTITGAGGGPGAQAQYSGNSVTVSDGSSSLLTWDSLDAGADLLDRAFVQAPAFLASGVYAITAQVLGDALTASGYAIATIGTASTAFGGVSGPYQTAHPEAVWGGGIVAQVEAGDQISLNLSNLDGVASRAFQLVTTTIVKLP